MSDKTLLPHTLSLQDRASLELTGVYDVERFSETLAVMRTDCGRLTVKGSGIKVTELNTDSAQKQVRLTGTINSLEYSGNSRTNESLARKLFG